MKQTIFYLCILLSGAMIEPKNSVTFEHFFKTEEDLFSAVAEIHGQLRETLLSVPYHEYMGAPIDRISGTASVYERLRNLDPNTVAADSRQEQWKKYYNVLTLADLFMDNYHKAERVNPGRLNFCIGQCHFAKAVCYMYLGRIWGDAVITKGSLYSGKYAKSPAKAVIDTAIAYARRAYDILPKYGEMRGIGGKALVSKQYGCKGSAAAVLAPCWATARRSAKPRRGVRVSSTRPMPTRSGPIHWLPIRRRSVKKHWSGPAKRASSRRRSIFTS